MSSGTYGMDELVEWFREEGVLVEDNTPREECYKIMWHTEEAWIVIIVVNAVSYTHLRSAARTAQARHTGMMRAGT